MRWLVVALALCNASQAAGQGARGTLSSVGRYIELRPIARDTVDSAQVTTHPGGALEFDGRPVFCAAGTCTGYRSAPVAHALTTTHDLTVTAWGFGVTGLSLTAMVRARTDVGGDFAWPRSDDRFDAILAYVDFARDRYRLRAGRQRALTGLGFYSFDGIAALFDATSAIHVEAYLGRSLARALEEPRNTALSAVEQFVPGQQAWLLGTAAELSASGSSVALRYQREILSDRSGLLSERAALDFTSSQLPYVRIEGAADYDVAFGHVGKAHLTGRLPLQNGRVNVELTARRYMPFFELWTIWGVFSPVAYHEAELQAGWSARPWLGLWGRTAIRKYQDTDASIFGTAPRTETRLFALRAHADATPSWRIDGEARLENAFGAYLGSGELGAGWQASQRLRLAAYATAFQQILEFRIGEAAVLGLGASADYALRENIQASAGATLYRQRYQNRPSGANWNQQRAWLSLEWRFGRDPGLRAQEPSP